MAEMIATLSDACEREFGFLAARLFRVFKNDEVQGNITDFGFSRVMTFQPALRGIRGFITILNKATFSVTRVDYYPSVADKLEHICAPNICGV